MKETTTNVPNPDNNCWTVVQSRSKTNNINKLRTNQTPAARNVRKSKHPKTGNPYSSENQEHDRMSLVQPELEFAIKNFKSNYDKFAKCHAGRLVRMEGEAIESAIDAAAREENLGASALLLESEIGNILSQIKRTRQIRDAGWTGKLAKFIGKLYPLATTCFRLTNAAAEVVSSCGNFRLTTQAASIIPLKGVTDGVAIILQVYLYCFALVLNQKILETSQRMTEDFYLQL